jgi:hypothetical protein
MEADGSLPCSQEPAGGTCSGPDESSLSPVALLIYFNIILQSIAFNGKFLRFRRDGVSISYTVICLSHFDVCPAIT